MNKYRIGLIAFLAGSLLFTFCRKVPVTGRSQVNLVSESKMIEMSNEQYAEVLRQGPLSTNTAEVTRIKTIGNNIKTAVEKYMQEQGRSGELTGYNWEFNLIQNDTIQNAWCMPGGKVAFYTGILPICKSDAGIAVVMGHEVAHAIARHGNERMSQGLIAQSGGTAVNIALSNKSAATQNLFQQAYGVTAQYGLILPYSRKHESEADHMGLIFMAMAGYDPSEAVTFWERMKAAGGQEPPEFSSTHPSNTTRIEDMKANMPEAMKYYKK